MTHLLYIILYDMLIFVFLFVLGGETQKWYDKHGGIRAKYGRRPEAYNVQSRKSERDGTLPGDVLDDRRSV